MAHPNPAHHRFHAIEIYQSRPRAVRRVAQVNGAGYRAYLIVVGRQTIVHVSEGKRPDLSGLPRPADPR
jgi:hypothetical protein